ncbi:MAG: hypothetical protein BroJett013_02970 [Alphaproteobacteria bacterium]|nr:MAG: hypothetical protein BroJett013_02970 [Alphaproteobacteria bacterium]
MTTSVPNRTSVANVRSIVDKMTLRRTVIARLRAYGRQRPLPKVQAYFEYAIHAIRRKEGAAPPPHAFNGVPCNHGAACIKKSLRALESKSGAGFACLRQLDAVAKGLTNVDHQQHWIRPRGIMGA